MLKLDGTHEAGPRAIDGYGQYEPHGHIDLWQPYAAGYEHPIHTAQIYARAYELTGDEVLLLAAVRWADFNGTAAPLTHYYHASRPQKPKAVGAARKTSPTRASTVARNGLFVRHFDYYCLEIVANLKPRDKFRVDIGPPSGIM